MIRHSFYVGFKGVVPGRSPSMVPNEDKIEIVIGAPVNEIVDALHEVLQWANLFCESWYDLLEPLKRIVKSLQVWTSIQRLHGQDVFKSP